MKIGSKLRTVRTVKNLKQENMAEILGLSQSGYAKIERDEVEVKLDRLAQITNALGMNVEDFLTLDTSLIFNNNGGQNQNINKGTLNYFPEDIKVLYERQIAALESIIVEKTKIISILENKS